jgi:hypothetical protein
MLGWNCELVMSFSLGETISFSLLLVSPRQSNAWLSPQWLLSRPTPVWDFSALCSASLPQAEGKYSLHVFGHKFCPERCNWLPGCARICGFLPKSVLHSPGGLADSLGWKQISYRAVQVGGRQKFCVLLCMQVLVFPDACSSSFCGSLCCIIVG